MLVAKELLKKDKEDFEDYQDRKKSQNIENEKIEPGRKNNLTNKTTRKPRFQGVLLMEKFKTLKQLNNEFKGHLVEIGKVQNKIDKLYNHLKNELAAFEQTLKRS